MLPIIVIVGPTASGKSELAVRLAHAFGTAGAEIIGADSMQIYREFNIGTGKLSMSQRAGVTHHLIDILEPNEGFSAAKFVDHCDMIIAQLHQRQIAPIIAGGTGLYVRALTRGLFSAPPADPIIRATHQTWWQKPDGPAQMYQRLTEVDPTAAAAIKPQDFVRICRALEVFEQTQTPISELQAQHRFAQPRYNAIVIGLRPVRTDLNQQIERRIDHMLAHGWIDEVQSLMHRGYGETHPMKALGYRRLYQVAQGQLTLDDAICKIKSDTRHFARRQLNWFAAEPNVTWYTAPDEVPIVQIAKQWFAQQISA